MINQVELPKTVKNRFFLEKHLKTFFLAAVLFFSADGLMAQEKYDYATIIWKADEIGISINGKSFELIKVGKEDKVGYLNVNSALKELNKLEDKGWELFDTGFGSLGIVFYLRRKEQ